MNTYNIDVQIHSKHKVSLNTGAFSHAMSDNAQNMLLKHYRTIMNICWLLRTNRAVNDDRSYMYNLPLMGGNLVLGIGRILKNHGFCGDRSKHVYKPIS